MGNNMGSNWNRLGICVYTEQWLYSSIEPKSMVKSLNGNESRSIALDALSRIEGDSRVLALRTESVETESSVQLAAVA